MLLQDSGLLSLYIHNIRDQIELMQLEYGILNICMYFWNFNKWTEVLAVSDVAFLLVFIISNSSRNII